MEISNGIVIALGIGIVFAGLICIVIICSLMGAICKHLVKIESNTRKEEPQSGAIKSALESDTPIENKQQILAAVCAVIAEELGTDANNIRVTSFKKI